MQRQSAYLTALGSAFYAWDRALKGGDPRIIGALAYLTPMVSTGVLVVLGGKEFTPVSLVAIVLIVGGAAVGSKDLLYLRTVTDTQERSSAVTH